MDSKRARARRLSAAAIVASFGALAIVASASSSIEAASPIEPREIARLPRCKGVGTECKDALDHCCSDLSCMEGRCCAHVGGACAYDDDCCFADCEKGVCGSGR